MEADTTGPASPTDPPQDQPGSTVPDRIAFLLHAVDILLGYGHLLLNTIRHRATTPPLTRGILRAPALERLLLARAATGRDIPIPPRRIRTDEAPPAPTAP